VSCVGVNKEREKVRKLFFFSEDKKKKL
jgi:hypothetical protein